MFRGELVGGQNPMAVYAVAWTISPLVLAHSDANAPPYVMDGRIRRLAHTEFRKVNGLPLRKNGGCTRMTSWEDQNGRLIRLQFAHLAPECTSVSQL